MSILIILGSLVGSAIRVYPETRVVRFLIGRLGVEEKQKIILTLIFTLLLDIALLEIFNYATNQIVLLLCSDLITLTLISIKDHYIGSAFNRFVSKKSFKVIFGTFFFFILFFILMAVLPVFGVSDPYYLWCLFISLFYCYLGFWRKERIKAPEGAQSI